MEILGWKEVKSEDGNIVSPNIISKLNIFVPIIDHKNIENILLSLDIKPIRLLKNMRERVDFYY